MKKGYRNLRTALGLLLLGLACAGRQVPLDGEERRRWEILVSAEITLDGGEVIVLPDRIHPARVPVCVTEEEMGDWDFRTEVLNEIGYERCLELVEDAGYDPADSDCDDKRTALGHGWWALSVTIPTEQFINGEPAPLCDSASNAGCGR